jgi:hypothetical protein
MGDRFKLQMIANNLFIYSPTFKKLKQQLINELNKTTSHEVF